MKKNKIIWISIIIAIFLVATLISAQILLEKTEQVTLSFVGDVMLSRHVGEKIEQTSVKFPFVNVAKHLSEADLAFANLETQISDNEGIDWKSCCKFKAKEEVARGLVYSGIDVFSVANNHVLDFGPETFEDTLNLLENNGLSYVGADKIGNKHSELLVYEVKDKKIGFLAYYDKNGDNDYIKNNSWLPQPVILVEDNFLEDIREADEKVDVLVISVHWGEEYQKEHNERQKYLAHLAIDNGAEIIVGHHPHVLQEIEEYNEGIIAYSLGNFVFDQPTSETPVTEGVRDSIILDVKINGEEITYSTIPVKINNYYQPTIK